MKNKSIKKNAILNTIRTVLNLIFPLVTFPYVTRTLSVNEVGKYNFSQSIITYFLLIAALGIDKYAIREGAKFRDNSQKISDFASEVFTVNIVSTLIAYFLLFIYLSFSSKAHSYISCILIFSLQIIFTTIGTEWLYSIFEEYTYITIRSIIFKIISLILLFTFVRQPEDYLKYTAITVFSTVGSNILNFIHARKLCNIHLKFNFDWESVLKPILTIFATNIAIQIYVSSDTTMLGYIKNDYTVAIYSVSTKVYNVLKPVLSAALTVTVPRFALYAGKGEKREYNRLMLKVINSLLVIVIPSMIGLIMLSRDIVIIIGGQQYVESQTSLVILSIAIIFSIFSGLFNQCALLPYHREKYSLRASIISALENIGLNFLLIPKFAERGAAITTVLAEMTMAIMNFYSSRDVVINAFKNKHTIRNIFDVLLGSIAVAVVCYGVCYFISSIVLQTIISIILSIIVYLALMLWFRNKIVRSLIKDLREKMVQS